MIDRKLLTQIFGNRSLQIALTLGLIVTSSAIVLGVRASNRQPLSEFRGISKEIATESAPSVLPVTQDAPNARLRTEHITAFPHGFEPDELWRPPGAFMLCIDNRAGSEGLSFRLISADTKQLIRAEAVRKGNSGTNKVLALAPGVYTLTEDSHPQWSCTITITQ